MDGENRGCADQRGEGGARQGVERVADEHMGRGKEPAYVREIN